MPERDPGSTRWCFADQLGPHFLDDAAPDARDGGDVVLVEATSVFRRRAFHRRKAHLVLSALRHRAAELGDRARHVRADTYVEGLAEAGVSPERPVSVCDPTTWAARRLVRRLAAGDVGPGAGSVRVLAPRGFASGHGDFAAWVADRGERRLLQDDWYRRSRRRLGVLVEADGEPVGGRWSFDEDNREPPPRGATTLVASDAPATEALREPWWPQEDDVDAEVRDDLDRMARDDGVTFLGDDGPRRFAVTHDEARRALRHFLAHRLDAFGPYEDAMLAGDRWMAHSLLSAPLNLGLLDPVRVARDAVGRLRHGARLASVEGFVRQVVGWRDYVWHLYWQQGEDYRRRNALQARRALPEWFADLDAGGQVRAACLSDVLGSVREEGWAHHIPRLMVLGNWALQHRYDPRAVTDWFHRAFVDGYDWVMVPNVVGMSLHGDGGVMATKPYASGGAYIDRMSDYCGRCPYDPKVRVGETACPFTAGYWAFVDANRERLAGNPRTSRAVAGLDRLKDRDALLEQERRRGGDAP
ncbi:cryptochrome/photolyase family protein [Aquipuribacter nitratireducens]|uniref:Cryptochrome/photolyase family protein n=1 Tax=Aquipuribacter nitratireducens TaxID=650104 RepID=A0ABW0GJ04_9MICO